jgi:hypothetical protein
MCPEAPNFLVSKNVYRFLSRSVFIVRVDRPSQGRYLQDHKSRRKPRHILVHIWIQTHDFCVRLRDDNTLVRSYCCDRELCPSLISSSSGGGGVCVLSSFSMPINLRHISLPVLISKNKTRDRKGDVAD